MPENTLWSYGLGGTNPMCSGASSTFIATATNGGATPVAENTNPLDRAKSLVFSVFGGIWVMLMVPL